MTTGEISNSSPAAPSEITALTMTGHAVSVAEVIRAAYFRGDLQSHWDDLVLRHACQQKAVEEGLEADMASLQARADQFRYERDLITTEETEQWLDRRLLESNDFEMHVLRGYWKDTIEDKVDPDSDPLTLDDATKAAQLTVGLFLNGSFAIMVKNLAWRMASRRDFPEGDNRLAECIEAERAEFFERNELEAKDLPGWLAGATGDEAWFEEMLALEAAYNLEREATLTPEQLTRTLRSQRLALMKFEVEEIEFDSPEAAREAVLCVREDHLSMKEVADDSRYPYFEREFLLEELPQEWQMAIFSTPENSLAGPFTDEELIRLFRIVRKVEPVITDEAVRSRLEEHLTSAHFEEACAAQGLKSLWIRSTSG